MTDPIYYYATTFLQKKENNFTTFDDMKGHSIGTVTGFTPIPEMKTVPGVTEVKLYDTSDAVIRDVVAGKLDIALIDPTLVEYALLQHPEWGLHQLPVKAGHVKALFELEPRGAIESKHGRKLEMFFLNRLKPEYSRDADGRMPSEKFFAVQPTGQRLSRLGPAKAGWGKMSKCRVGGTTCRAFSVSIRKWRVSCGLSADPADVLDHLFGWSFCVPAFRLIFAPLKGYATNPPLSVKPILSHWR